MKVYHGSTICVSEPKLLSASRRLDFGSGFYTTTNLRQAKRWAQIKMRRFQSETAIVSIYEADNVFAAKDLRIKCFDTATEEWLDFVMRYRTGKIDQNVAYDVIRGPVANDTLYETLALYERGILTHAETVVRLRTHKLADQVVLATPRALALLHFVDYEKVS